MRKSRIWAAALAVTGVLFVVGCTDDGGIQSASLSPAAAPMADIDGIWVGQGSVTAGSQPSAGRRFNIVMTMSQVGDQVAGEILNANGTAFDITGTVDGHDLSFTITQNKPCAGTFSGAGTTSNGDTELIGSYSGTDCNGSISAEFTAVKNEREKPAEIRQITPLHE